MSEPTSAARSLRRRSVIGLLITAAITPLAACGAPPIDAAFEGIWDADIDRSELMRLARRLIAADATLMSEAEILRTGGGGALSRDDVRSSAAADSRRGHFVEHEGWLLPRSLAVLVVATWGP